MSDGSTNSVILPGATIGILGSGQLGKMMAVAAKRMGYRVHILSPDDDSPAGQVADLEITAEYTDLDAIDTFAKQVDVVTLEFENIPTIALEHAGAHAPVHPGIKTLWTTQNRGREKTFLCENDIPTCDFRVVRSLQELKTACESVFPAVLKTTEMGYDGKGQRFIRSEDEIESAWAELNTDEAIVEKLIDFDFEFSVVAARSSTGQVMAFPTSRNEHHNHILDVSVSPSGLDADAEDQANDIACRVMSHLESVGVLCVEFFHCRNGEILVNEIAPRPHNSGHLTIEANITCQFEQHIRAVCGLPLGSTERIKPAAMANLLGDEWSTGEPDWNRSLETPNVKLHLYGKHEAKVGRKMGHLTALADSPEQAVEFVKSGRKALTEKSCETKQRAPVA
jgi:5-(carboxyamino)imidazole ribonucleotide synthase